MKKTIGAENSPPVGDRETRQQILEVARELFLSKGYKGVSMKEVAEEVQVTSAALYYHFPGGKQDLFFNIIQKMLEDWTQGAILATAQSQGLQEESDQVDSISAYPSHGPLFDPCTRYSRKCTRS